VLIGADLVAVVSAHRVLPKACVTAGVPNAGNASERVAGVGVTHAAKVVVKTIVDNADRISGPFAEGE